MEPVNHPTEIGKIEIAPEVIQIVSSLAAVQAEGVVGLSGGFVGDISQLLGRKNLKQGVHVELGDQKNSIEISAVVEYGYRIPDVGREIQEKVKSAVESMTGIPIHEVRVRFEAVRLVQAKPEKEKKSIRLK